MSTQSYIHPELQIPDYGTEEYRIWWESQYDQKDNNHKPPMEVLEWADGFVGK